VTETHLLKRCHRIRHITTIIVMRMIAVCYVMQNRCTYQAAARGPS